MLIKDILTQSYLTNHFTFDISTFNELALQRSAISSKADIVLNCNRCDLSKSYQIRNLKETSKLKCRCKDKYKTFEDNAKEKEFLKKVVATKSKPKEPKTETLDISNLVIHKFNIHDNNHVTFKCCQNGFYSTNIISKLHKMSCPFGCQEPLKPEITITKPLKGLIKEINKLVEEQLDYHVLDKTDLFIITAQFVAEYENKNIIIVEELNKLKDEFMKTNTYNIQIADELERLYNKFKTISFVELTDFIVSDEELEELYKEYVYFVEKVTRTEDKLKSIEMIKKLDLLELEKQYYKIENGYEKEDFDKYFIQRIRKMINDEDFNLELLTDESLETFLKYNKKNKTLTVTDISDFYKIDCNKCNKSFITDYYAMKLCIKNIHSCPYCFSFEREPPKYYKDFKEIDMDFIKEKPELYYLLEYADLEYFDYRYIREGKYKKKH